MLHNNDLLKNILLICIYVSVVLALAFLLDEMLHVLHGHLLYEPDSGGCLD